MAGLQRAVFWALSLGVALVSWRFLVAGVEASMAFVAYHATERPLGFYAHVFFGPVALALAPFQFWSGLRARRPRLHRWMGRAYALAVLVAAMGGLSLALGTTAGPVAAAGFGVLAVVWLGVTARGVWLAMTRRIANHRRWMIRSAALSFAGVTLRLELPLMVAAGMEFASAYSVVAWACWVPNLLFAEWVLLRRRTAPDGARGVLQSR